jgi:sugar fermentation stimulation protein A
MILPGPPLRATLVSRYKRFLSDHTLEDGRVVTAHCPNPGRMLGLTTPGAETWLSPATSPTRKLRYTWQLIEDGVGLVGINTMLPNKLAEEAIEAGKITELAGYPTLKREVRYGTNSRIDLLLSGDDRRPCYVEIKNVHLRRNSRAEFPDSVTARGAKHLRELTDQVKAGDRAVMLYIVQRTDCEGFSLAGDIDPAYAAAFDQAHQQGVEAICYACDITNRSIVVSNRLQILE